MRLSRKAAIPASVPARAVSRRVPGSASSSVSRRSQRRAKPGARSGHSISTQVAASSQSRRPRFSSSASACEPIEIEVHDDEVADGVMLEQRVGRRRDAGLVAEAAQQRANERRLARAEIPAQTDQQRPALRGREASPGLPSESSELRLGAKVSYELGFAHRRKYGMRSAASVPAAPRSPRRRRRARAAARRLARSSPRRASARAVRRSRPKARRPCRRSPCRGCRDRRRRPGRRRPRRACSHL